MAVLVSAHQISKSFAARPLFSGITFAIESGERIGLIGPNGAGKSTLLKILAAETSPDSGTLSFQRGLRVGCLPQVIRFPAGTTVQSAILDGLSSPGHEDWEAISLAREFMAKLSLDKSSGIDSDTPVNQLSGGWQKRVALARELARHPDLLLLDEPTNHLDLESILWLEDLLARSNFATLTITHDRLFLQRIGNRILELDRRNPSGLLSVQGNYTTYLETKDRLMAAQERREVILRNTLRRETEWLKQGAKARTTKQQARIQRAGELETEVDELSFRNQSRMARLEFQGAEKNPKRLIEAKGIAKVYDDKQLFSGLDLVVTPGTRLGVLGPNGCGKSTLIRVLVGQEKPDSGSILQSDQLSVAYFEQNRETLDPTVTVLKTLCPVGQNVEYQGRMLHIRSYLDRFLFNQEQMDMAVGKLSGGEQSRLLIARLMLRKANVLVLDEPTNDLDIPTLNVLEECLKEFNGAVILVTHDRYFLDQVSTKILAFHKGSIVPFADLAQWEAWKTKEAEQARALLKSQNSQAPQPTGSKSSSSPSTPAPAKKRKLSFNEQREFDSIQPRIEAAEQELAKLTTESQLPENVSDAIRLTELTQAMAEFQQEIDRLYHRWAELEER